MRGRSGWLWSLMAMAVTVACALGTVSSAFAAQYNGGTTISGAVAVVSGDEVFSDSPYMTGSGIRRFWKVHLDAGDNLTIDRVTSTGITYYGAVRVYAPGTTDVDAANPLAYVLDNPPGMTFTRLSLDATSTGDHYLVVEVVNGDGASFDYRVTVTPSVSPTQRRACSVAAFSSTGVTTAWSSLTSPPKHRLSGRISYTAEVGDPALSEMVAGSVKFYYKTPTGSWTYLKSATVNSGGGFYCDVYLRTKLYYKAVFAGNSHLLAANSSAVSVLPKAYLSKPAASATTVTKGRVFTVSGYVGPAHPVTYPARLRCYRYENGHWVYRKTVYAKKVTGGATYTKYSSAVTLPYAGYWRIYAQHGVGVLSDADHAKTTSVYRSVKVNP